MYEGLRNRVNRSAGKLGGDRSLDFMKWMLGAVRRRADEPPDEDGIARVDVPDDMAKLGRRLGVPICMDD